MKKTIAEQEEYVQHHVKVPEDEQPDEELTQSLAKLEAYYAEIGEIAATISGLNNVYKLDTGQTIDQALIQRDILKARHKHYKIMLAHTESDRASYHHRTEQPVKKVILIPCIDIRNKITEIKRELFELEKKLQRANWECECV